MTYSYPIILQNQFTPPVQFGDTITTDNAEPGFGYENIMPVSELEIYYYHPDHLGSVSMTSDLNGTVSQYIEYIPFGEEMYSAHRNTYNSPYRYTAKELDEETGLYYYGARYYNPKLSIWLSVDPMVEKYISLSPYNYVMNNPIVFVDPDGKEVGDTQFGGAFAIRFGFKGGYSTSFALGASYRNGSFAGGLNLALNLYNFGLGTSHGTTGKYSNQIDFIASPSLTYGKGNGNPMKLNTFHNNSETGVQNSFKNSATIGSNFLLNSDGRNQQVGYFGGKIGDVGFNIYNDVFPVIGDRDDRWWTGGGSLQLGGANGTATLGADVFTGERKRDHSINPNNPANGKYGTYDQTTENLNLNNGQTLIEYYKDSLKANIRFAGSKHMYSQNLIHNTIAKVPFFESKAIGE